MLVDHPRVQRVLDFQPDASPPLVALEWCESEVNGDATASTLPLELAVEAAFQLAGVLSEAHRVGLFAGIGTLSNTNSLLSDARKFDLTRLRTHTGNSASSETEREPATLDGQAGRADEIAALGRLIARWLGRTGAVETRASHSALSTAGEIETIDLSSSGASLAARRLAEAAATENPSDLLDELLGQMTATQPLDRPSANAVYRELARVRGLVSDQPTHHDVGPEDRGKLKLDSTIQTIEPDGAVRERDKSDASAIESRVLDRLGRFQIVAKLGQGGMGAVYKGLDPTNGVEVALKVLRPDVALKPQSLRRFQKEARLLSEVNNPYVTNLLEVNEDDGVHYLVLDYVSGESMSHVLAERGPFEERTALTILADTCRALLEAHDRGVVHRDVKPANLLLTELTGGQGWNVRLSDFGLARHVEESESLQITQDHAVIGTPQYMAPEQCTGGSIDVRTDIYALGATLFECLAGRPPFSADTLTEIFAKHCNEAPPRVQQFAPSASDGVARIIDRCLAKAPDARYANAAALLDDLERLLRGEATSTHVHPRLPDFDPRELIEYDFRWELESSPRQLWPLVTNTERLNRAVGLPAVDFKTEANAEGATRRIGSAKQGGISATWEEHPFEWVEPRRFGVLREYSHGPFRWMISLVEMEPRSTGGTTLTHRVRIAAPSAIMRAAARLKVGRDSQRALERVYRRIDASLAHRAERSTPSDAFEAPKPLSANRQHRLDQLLDRLIEHGVHPLVAERLGEFLGSAAPQDVARIRPIALARRLGLDADQVISACLHGARDGLFVLLWDLLCPICRIPSEVKETLKQLQEHGRCEACNADFELDFSRSVEMIFRIHPEVRDAELGVYCIGGPAHSPHVVAQLRLAPLERVELDLELSAGVYRLRGPQLPYAIDFRVEPKRGVRRWDLDLRGGSKLAENPTLREGAQVLVIRNDFDREVVVRVERTAPRDDALTAARASSLALFRELFPGELLNPGQLLNIANVTLLITRLVDAGALFESQGDARAFKVLHDHFRHVDQAVRRSGGATIKTIGDGLVAVFQDAARAADVALAIVADNTTGNDASAIALHRGSALVATINDHLDYFGTMVRQAMVLPELAGPGEVVLSTQVASDPAVAALLHARSINPVVFRGDLPGSPDAPLVRVAPGAVNNAKSLASAAHNV